MSIDIGRIGIWSLELRFGEQGAAADAAAELDELGYGAIWIPGGIGGDLFGDVERLGPGKLLAPEQGVVLESSPARARELARRALSAYLRLPNYANNWRRLGFTEDDIAGPSDRLIDALFAWGGVDAIRARVDEHL